MLGFSPFKKHPNKFNYLPRYFNPEAERRAQRRAELRGERPEDAGRAYEPGQYIRTARTARAARREAERSERSRRRSGVLLVGAVLLLFLLAVVYPRLTELMRRSAQAPAAAAAVVEPVQPASEFDQSGISDTEWQQMPITVVPNDYEAR